MAFDVVVTAHQNYLPRENKCRQFVFAYRIVDVVGNVLVLGLTWKRPCDQNLASILILETIRRLAVLFLIPCLVRRFTHLSDDWQASYEEWYHRRDARFPANMRAIRRIPREARPPLQARRVDRLICCLCNRFWICNTPVMQALSALWWALKLSQLLFIATFLAENIMWYSAKKCAKTNPGLYYYVLYRLCVTYLVLALASLACCFVCAHVLAVHVTRGLNRQPTDPWWRGFGRTWNMVLMQDSQLYRGGTPRRTLTNLPTRKYTKPRPASKALQVRKNTESGSELGVPLNSGPGAEEEEEEEKAREETGQGEHCGICLAEYEEGETLRQLPCDHEFHANCVDTWLHSKTTCPFCRSDVTRRGETEPQLDHRVQAPAPGQGPGPVQGREHPRNRHVIVNVARLPQHGRPARYPRQMGHHFPIGDDDSTSSDSSGFYGQSSVPVITVIQ